MHELKITGDTPEALYFNVVKTLSIFLRGASPQTDPVSAQEKTEPAVVAPEEITRVEGSIPSGTGHQTTTEVREAVEEKITAAVKKRGAKAKGADKELNDEIPDLGAKTIEHEPQNLTLDGDIRPRLRAIQQACTKRGLDMQATIAYIHKLYGPFGIAKAEQLRSEQFAEFMELSEGYLSGEA